MHGEVQALREVEVQVAANEFEGTYEWIVKPCLPSTQMPFGAGKLLQLSGALNSDVSNGQKGSYPP